MGPVIVASHEQTTDMTTKTNKLDVNRRRKNSTPRSSNKPPRVLASDAHWRVSNNENLSVKTFAQEFKHTDRSHCHARYKNILENYIPQSKQSQLIDEFNNWRKPLIASNSGRNSNEHMLCSRRMPIALRPLISFWWPILKSFRHLWEDSMHQRQQSLPCPHYQQHRPQHYLQ